MIRRYFERTREWYAVPWCHGESVLDQAYYHFFCSIVLPLLELASQRIFTYDQRIYVLSCGRYDAILHELKRVVPVVPVPDEQVLSNLVRRCGANIDQLILDSLEAYVWRHGRFGVRPVALDGMRFMRIAKFAKTVFPPDPPSSPAEVLFVSRAKGIRGHGGEIRGIANEDDIVSALERDGASVDRVSLEGRSLAEQISIFHHAKIVIGQHGAGLANLVWTQPGRARLIELVPPQFRRPGWHYFEVLSEALGIPRLEIPQIDSFAPVPIEPILTGVRSFRDSATIGSAPRSAVV